MVRAKNYGRMGNVLYQNGAAIAYALKHDMEFSVPFITTSPKWNPLYTQHLVNSKWQEGREDVIIRENGHQYTELPFRSEWKDLQIVLDGYFQSYKYMEGYFDKVAEYFAFPYNYMEGVVSVHIRRGDYLELKDKHPDVPTEWVLKAMSMFPNKHFLFMSDDIEYCKQTYGHLNNVSFSAGRNEVDDLSLMSSCEHGIYSSSTFSVWGYMLNRNPNKIGVFPEKWFCDGYQGLITTDIVPPECIKLKL